MVKQSKQVFSWILGLPTIMWIYWEILVKDLMYRNFCYILAGELISELCLKKNKSKGLW